MTRSAVWAVPVVAAVAAAPAFAVSTCTRTFQVGRNEFSGTGNPFLGPSVATALRVGGLPGLDVTVTFTDISPYNSNDPIGAGGVNAGVPRGEGKHMSFGTAAYNANSGNEAAGNIGNDGSRRGLILNLRGGRLATQNSRVIQVTFSTQVYDLSFDVRDLSWHNDGTAVREAISFNTATSVKNVTNKAAGAGGDLNVPDGPVPAGTEIFRGSSGNRPNVTNSGFYDLTVTIPGPITTFNLTFGRKTGETTESFAAAQLTDFAFCTTG